MKRNTLLPCLILIFFTINEPSYSQQYKLKTAQSESGNPTHFLLLTPQQDYIDISGPLPGERNKNRATPSITRYDNKLKAVYNNPLTDLADKEIQAAQYKNGNLIVYWINSENQVGFSLIDDNKGTVRSSPVTLFTTQGDDADNFTAGGSANGNYQFVFARSFKKKDEGRTFDGAIMDASGKIIKKFSYTTPEEKNAIKTIRSIQCDDGTLYITYGSTVKKSNNNSFIPIEYTVLQITTAGKVTARKLAALPEGNIRNLTCQAKGSDLVFHALLSRDKKSGFTDFLTGSFDGSSGKVTVKQTDIMSLPSVKDLNETYLKKVISKGLPADMGYDTTIHYNDGSSALVYQVSSLYIHQSYYAVTSNNGMNPNTPSYSVPKELRKDIYVIKVDASGAPTWVKVIPKDQQESDVNLCIGFACTTDDKNNLHFFFYDVETNESAEPGKRKPIAINTGAKSGKTLACVRLTPAGVATKKFIDVAGDNFYFSPERSRGLKANELMFLSIRKKGMAFKASQLFNNAVYRWETITIK